jgi:hypothetical protein
MQPVLRPVVVVERVLAKQAKIEPVFVAFEMEILVGCAPGESTLKR